MYVYVYTHSLNITYVERYIMWDVVNELVRARTFTVTVVCVNNIVAIILR